MKLIQVKYRIYYYLRNKFFKYKVSFAQQHLDFEIDSSLQFEASLPTVTKMYSSKNKFTFLNQSWEFAEGIDWNLDKYGKLWTYNLNYFEYLHQYDIQVEEGLGLIHNFIAQEEKIRDGFEPYPTSLRIINWIKFLIENAIHDKNIDEFLFFQVTILEKNLEYHLLGNHLLENGFALLFAAYYFSDESIYKKARDILESELEEQILSDGAHFELSPMYHQLMLYRVLDCYNLIKNNHEYGNQLLSILESKAEKMLGWLVQISFNNGDIPLLNDCAFYINPGTKELLDYGRMLGIEARKCPLSDSGYRKREEANYEIITDIGKVGPKYQPGHAHSDTFSFSLYSKGKPFIVDTGTSTYALSQQRQLERSTASHNTVQIENHEQIEIWSAFRVARRNEPIIEIDELERIKAKLKYATRNYWHTRQFDFFDRRIKICDEITGCNEGFAYFHFHPKVGIELKKNKILSTLGTIEFNGAKDIYLKEYNYAPELNKKIASKKVVVAFSDSLMTSIFI